jgi:hypothetical protein
MCNDSLRCPSAPQFVVNKDALQLIESFVFSGSVMCSDDIRKMMLPACPDEQHQDPVSLTSLV